MLGYVSREEYERAVERAARAEGAAEALREMLKAFDDRADRAERRADALLERFLPGRKAAAPLTADERAEARLPRPVTSEEIMRQPAIGRRGLAERDRLKREAEEREAIASTRRSQASALAPEEESELLAELEGA